MNIDIEEMKKRLALGQFNLFEVTNLIEENYRLYSALEDSTNKLQAAESKLEEMSKQEPVAWIIEYDVNGVIKTSAEQSNELSYFEWIDDGKEYPAIGSKPLFLHPQVQSNADKEIPEGWQLVPKILTREMYQATGFVKSAPHDLWDKLLSVAPKFVAQQLQNGE